MSRIVDIESGLISFIPETNIVHFDIMVGRKWCGQTRLTLLPGFEYKEKELSDMVLKERPSLNGKDFILVPTNQRV